MKQQGINETTLNTNAIIIGAGPAGAAASIFLSIAGINHIVIEKELFPRDKICGDACSGKTVSVLRRANPLWLDEIFENATENTPCKGVIFASPNGKQLNIPFNTSSLKNGHAPGFMSQRLVFDNFLFEKMSSTYANIFQQAQIKKIEKKEEKIFVSFIQNDQNFRAVAPIIVGADGDKSQVRKLFLSNHTSAKAYCVGLRAYYKNVQGLHKDNFIELHSLPEILPGYFWIFPLPNGLANVGIGMMSDRIRAKKINLRKEMLDAIKSNPNISCRFANATLVDKIQGWGLPMCMKQQPISGDNFLLTGDAASLIDPFSGEGIGNGLYSGMLAAFAIEESLKVNRHDRNFLKEKYDDVLFKKIGGELRTSAALQKLCHYPSIFNFVINKAHKSKTLNKTITSMFTGIDLKKELRKPAFYAKILLNK